MSNVKQIRNLVLGGDGFIGVALCKYLKSIGESVVSADIKNGCDVRNIKFDIHQYDHIYFLAWDVGGAKYLADTSTFKIQMQWNLEILLNMMPQLQNAVFLFVSSQLSDDFSPYGATKRIGEVWTAMSSFGVSVRLWNVYGPLEPIYVRSHVVSDFITQALSSGNIKIMTDGNELRQFTHISDVCVGLHSALEHGRRGVYDLPASGWISILDVAKIIQKLTGCKIEVGCDIGRMLTYEPKNILPGWCPKVDIVTGIKMMLDEYNAI